MPTNQEAWSTQLAAMHFLQLNSKATLCLLPVPPATLLGLTCAIQQQSPTRDCFHGRQFSHVQEWRWWFQFCSVARHSPSAAQPSS